MGQSNATRVLITDTVSANTTFDETGSSSGWSCADGDPLEGLSIGDEKSFGWASFSEKAICGQLGWFKSGAILRRLRGGPRRAKCRADQFWIEGEDKEGMRVAYDRSLVQSSLGALSAQPLCQVLESSSRRARSALNSRMRWDMVCIM